MASGGARFDRVMGLLAEIVAAKQAEVRTMRGEPRHARPTAWAVRDVRAALQRAPGEPLRLIAEVKFRSPSAGALSRTLSPAARALAYQRAGAAMVSVLTDARWFDGAHAHLAAAREPTHIPLLCKDFVIDPVQVERAWASGADAVLLIVRCLPGDTQLSDLVLAARERGIEAFVEIVDEHELARALDAGARVVGVNARDLDSLAMDAARAERVLASIPQGVVAVHLSGVKTATHVRAIAGSRADAALLGEALMREEDPTDLLTSLVAASVDAQR